MTPKFKLTAISAAVISTLMASSVSANDNKANEKQKKEKEIEVIEVTGFVGSLRKAINAKKFSDGIVDSIHAEDVGKSTDQNIADALSRVTGVTVQEQDGEGTRISVRGAGAALNQVSMNGVAITSGLNGSDGTGTSDQSVDLSSFSSDILSSIDVIKTPSADHDEGSLGANVILRTVKPLNLNKNKRTFEVQGRYNGYSDEFDRKLSASFSHKLLDNTVGVILTVSDETQNTRRDQLSGRWDDEVGLIQAGRALDAKTGQVIESDTWAIARVNNNMSLNLNQRNRQTANLGIQYQPFDTTDIQFDASHTKQEVKSDWMSINARGDMPGASTTRPNLDTDPQQEWWTVDQESHALTKSLGRYNKGGLSRRLGGKEVKTSIASLSLSQEIGDSILLDIKGGYSKTTDDTLPNAFVNTATWAITNAGQIGDVPSDQIQPVGYDCSTGQCTFIFGNDAVLNDATSITTNGNYVNTTTNPLNPYSMHMGTLGRYDTHATDTNKSLFIDLDWDTEFSYITQVEAGIKFSQRIKEVDQNKQDIVGEQITAFDPVTGMPLKTDSPQDILLVDFMSSEAFPVDNFMEGLVPNRQQEFLSGWSMIDPFAAFEAAFTKPDAQIRPDKSESRKVTQDNFSIYGKLNFEALDGRLTGNIGARYVKTEVEADAYTSVKFESRNNMFSPYDLVYKKGLANSSLPVCDPTIFDNGGLNHQFSAQPNCYDWALTHMTEFRDKPGTEPHYTMEDRDGDGVDERYVSADWLSPDNELYALQVAYNEDGTVAGINRNVQSDGTVDGVDYEFSRDWWIIKRWLDLLTSDAVGEELFGEADKSLAANRLVPTSDKADNSILLPSLNLNYAFSDEVIGRFAVSKTMSRPTFDDLRPRANINENPWGDTGWGNRTTTQLQPLESKNLDLSLEWYFNESGLLSVAYFRKDMKNFLHSISETFYYKDIREQYDLGNIAIDDLFIVPEDGMTPENSGCMPDRMIQSQVKDAWTFGCHPVDISIKRNGKGSVNQGIEINYTQKYDFLPGIFSGLGVNLNYTYADSENDPEKLIASDEVLEPFPQAWTPKHSSNSTIFWEGNGLELRLAHRYNSVQLAQQTATIVGASWLDATNRLDFSASYKLNDNVQFTFHALNLTDDVRRTFYTSTKTEIPVGAVDYASDTPPELTVWNEGNALDGNVDKSKTISEYKTGVNYRVGVRVNF